MTRITGVQNDPLDYLSRANLTLHVLCISLYKVGTLFQQNLKNIVYIPSSGIVLGHYASTKDILQSYLFNFIRL